MPPHPKRRLHSEHPINVGSLLPISLMLDLKLSGCQRFDVIHRRFASRKSRMRISIMELRKRCRLRLADSCSPLPFLSQARTLLPIFAMHLGAIWRFVPFSKV